MTEKRDQVLALRSAQQKQREKLSADLGKARIDLHPRTLSQRWLAQKRQSLKKLGDNGKQSVAKNAPLLGVLSAALLLFVARKPISDGITLLRRKARQSKDRNI